MEMNQDRIDSIEVYDPLKNCHYRITVPNSKEETVNDEISENEEEIRLENPSQRITVWTQTETLALINIFSLHKDKFKGFKKKRKQWSLISEELARIGIEKGPDKCEIKWKNLLRIYRQYKHDRKKTGRFEFFNELDDIISKDPQFRYISANLNRTFANIGKPDELPDKCEKVEVSTDKKRKCSCLKSEKQKRHDERVALMTKKLEIEERKVTAFEEYLKFLKSN